FWGGTHGGSQCDDRDRIVQILAGASLASHNFANTMLFLALLLAAGPTGTTVTPFRTEVTPRVDPVFGDIASLRQSIDRFLSLQGEMDQVRSEFSTAVQGTLFQLAPLGPKPKGCPAGATTHYAHALA